MGEEGQYGKGYTDVCRRTYQKDVALYKELTNSENYQR